MIKFTQWDAWGYGTHRCQNLFSNVSLITVLEKTYLVRLSAVGEGDNENQTNIFIVSEYRRKSLIKKNPSYPPGSSENLADMSVDFHPFHSITTKNFRRNLGNCFGMFQLKKKIVTIPVYKITLHSQSI